MPRQYKPMPHGPAPAHATWIVVADAGRARIFEAGREDQALTELSDLLNAEARTQDHDRLSDRRGEIMQGAAHIGHALEPRESHGEHIARSFAKDLAHRLNSALACGKIARLYLLIEPRFLGLLRAELDSATRAAVAKEVATDLTRQPASHIRSLLPARL